MRINNLYVQNFKSIDEVQLDFEDLNILIGKNAAGKSNFLELFQFLKDIGEHGLEDAIHLRGGVEYFRNTKIGEGKNFQLECEFSLRQHRGGGPILELDGSEYHVSGVYSTEYHLEIGFSGSEYNVVDEAINNSRHIMNEERTVLQEKIRREKDREITTSWVADDEAIDLEDLEIPFFGPRSSNTKISEKESILSTSHPARPFFRGFGGLTDAVLYDIDPTRIKQGTTLKGKRELEENGENLPLVLKEIVTSDNDKDKFLNLVSDVLPFIKDWRTDTLRDKSIFLKILEEFEDKEEEYLPADLISDGTVNIIALIVILYFESNNIVLIEEPERNIHPALISNVVEMMEDVSKNSDKQVFTTSHNVELIKNSNLANILLVTRNQEGFTEIERPKESERVKSFLEHGMGLEKLYVNNILEEEL